MIRVYVNEEKTFLGGSMKHNNTIQLVDRPHFSRWQALYLSFYSSALYVDVAKRWKGLGLIYLLLAIVITTCPYVIKSVAAYNTKVNEQFILVLKELPPITVTNGEISIDKMMPYAIRNNKGDIVAMIDTQGSFQKVKQENPELILFIDKNTIYAQQTLPDQEVVAPDPFQKMSIKKSSTPSFTTKKFSEYLTTVIHSEDIISLTHAVHLKWFLVCLLYISMLSMLFTFYLFFIFVLAFIAQLVAHLFFRVPLSFAASFRLLAVAVTPSAALFFPLMTFNILPPGNGLFFLFLFFGYFFFGLIHVRRENRAMVHA